MNNIREMLKYRDAAMIKGWFADEFPKIAKADPNYVAALKSGMQLNLSGIKDLAASHTGRILESMTDAIQTGTPRPGIPESAARALGEQLMVANQMVIKRNDYIQQYKDIIPDPNRLSTAISNVFLKNNPVDEHGNIHPEMVDKLDKVATPERMKMEAYPLNYVRMRMPNGSVGKVSRDSVNELLE
jgi:hypothetical protein